MVKAAVHGRLNDETGIDWLGSDEVMVQTVDATGCTVTDEIGDSSERRVRAKNRQFAATLPMSGSTAQHLCCLKLAGRI